MTQENMPREQWLEVRKQGLGGTDIAAICGVNPYKKPIDVYLSKRGLIEENETNAAMTWGIRQEPLIADYYAEQHGVELIEPGFMVHPRHEWVVGTPDRLIVNIPKGLEVKTASLRVAHQWGEPGTDEVPDSYLLQCGWYMAITEYPEWDIAVKIDSADYREYTILRNPKLEARILEIGEEFWFKHIVAGIPPEPDGSENYVNYIKAAYPKDSGEMILVAPGDHLHKVAEELNETEIMLKRLKERSEELKNIMRSAIGDKSGLDGGCWKVTWKKAKDTPVTDYQRALDNLAQELGIPAEVIEKAVAAATQTKEGVRRFLPNFKGLAKAEEAA